jgi:hypothetical protein
MLRHADVCGDEVADGLHDLGGLLRVLIVASALDDPEARVGDPGRQVRRTRLGP